MPTARSLTFAPFRVRSFRFQWPADLLASWALEMETIILAWYVMVQTGSVLMLTVFGSLQYIGTLAAPMFGVLGDRLGSRDLLCAMRAAYAVLAAVVMTLAFTGLLTSTQVLVVATIAGTFRPNDLVMRNTMIGETIPPEHLTGALGMSRATQDSARVAGALAGAALSAALGIGRGYVVVVIFYLLSVALTLGVPRGRPVPDPAAPRLPLRGAGARLPRTSTWREMVEGLAHVWNTPRVLAAMWLAFLVNVTAYPITSGLLPYVAREIYRTDARGLGFLVAGFSLGALIGSIWMVVTGGPRHPERATIVNAGAWYVLLLGFGHVTSMGWGVLGLVLAGIVQSIAMISMAGTLLHAAGDRFRSRVMGVRTLAVYGLPIGLMASGALVDRVGYAATVTVFTVAGLGFTALIGFRWRADVWSRV